MEEKGKQGAKQGSNLEGLCAFIFNKFIIVCGTNEQVNLSILIFMSIEGVDKSTKYSNFYVRYFG